MKILFTIFLILFTVQATFSQYSFHSAASSSGVVVGSTNNSKFADINYSLSSSKLGFTYASTTQTPITNNSVSTFPNFWGHNAFLGVSTTDNNAALIKKKKWDGTVDVSYDIFYTIDKTPVATNTTSVVDINDYFNTTDATRKLFATREECEVATKGPCTAIPGTRKSFSHKVNRNNLQQFTFFTRFSSTFGKQNLAIPVTNFKDSIETKTETSIVPRFTIGVNFRQQLSGSVTLTLALSGATYFLSRSVSKLTSYTFQQIGSPYNHGANIQLAESKSYYLGKSEKETQFNPRIDGIFSVFLGETLPYLNLIGAYSPTYSSFSDTGWKHNYAIGIGFSLPKIPDQLLFAILLEGLDFNASDISKRTTALNFYTTVPFSFK